MKNKKNVIKIAAIIGGALLLSVGAFFAYKKFGPKKEEETAPEGGNEGGTADANRSISSSNTSSTSMNTSSTAANAAIASIMSGSSTPSTTSTTRPKVVSNYSDKQRVYARVNSGLYDKPVLRSANITHQVVKDQPIGVFRHLSVSGDFAYLTVVLKDKTGKYTAQYKYIPLANIRPANLAKGEKN